MAKTATLIDDFTTKDTAKWSWWSPGASISSGRLALVQDTGFGAGIQSNNSYDLTGSAVSVKAVQIPAISGADSILTVSVGTGVGSNAEVMMVRGTSLMCRELVGGSASDVSVTWDPVAMLYWRISADASSNVTWQTSPDGLTWTTRRTKASGIGALSSNIYLAMWCGYFGASGGTVLFDDFNILPVVDTGNPGQFFAMLG